MPVVGLYAPSFSNSNPYLYFVMSVFNLANGTLQPVKPAGNGTGNGHPADLVARQERLNAATLESMKNEPPAVRVFVTEMGKLVQEVYPGMVRDVTMKKSGFKLPRGVDSTGKYPPLDVYEVWFNMDRHPHSLLLHGTPADQHDYFAKWGRLLRLWAEAHGEMSETPDCNLLMDASLHTMEGDMSLRLLIAAKPYPPYIQRYVNYRHGEYCESRLKTLARSDVQTYETMLVTSRLMDTIKVRERSRMEMRKAFMKDKGPVDSAMRALEDVILNIVRLFTAVNDQARVEFLIAPLSGEHYVLRASNLSSISLPTVAHLREKHASYVTGASYGLEKHFNTLDQVAPLPPLPSGGGGGGKGKSNGHQEDVASMEAESLVVHCTHSMYVDLRLQIYSQELSEKLAEAEALAKKSSSEVDVGSSSSSSSVGYGKKRTREEMEEQPLPSSSSMEDNEEGTMIETDMSQGPPKRFRIN